MTVLHWGERFADLSALPLPNVDARAILFFAADSTPSEVQYAWEMPIVRRFSQLAMRARGQNCHIMAYSTAPTDVVESRVKSLGADNTMACASLDAVNTALGRLVDAGAMPRAWADALVDSPYASVVVMPGAEPFNRTGATLFLQVDGFVSLHAVIVFLAPIVLVVFSLNRSFSCTLVTVYWQHRPNSGHISTNIN